MIPAPMSSPSTKPAVFFDDGLGLLSPLTDLRASFDVRTGALTTRERWCRALGLRAAALLVPTHLAALTAEQNAGTPVNTMPGGGEVLVVNGRWVLPHASAAALAVGEAMVCGASGEMLAARVAAAEVAALAARGWKGDGLRCRAVADAALLTRPWHVRTFRDAALDCDLGLLAKAIPSAIVPQHVAIVPGSPIVVAASAKIGPGVIFDAEAGPIVIDEHALVRPGASLIGPVYLGPHSTVLDKALIKAHTAIGPWCKVAGEVGGTIFQGFANKAHDGHLGDSWVGEWANLGAGTTNSNLLNTYGEVVCRAFEAGAQGAPGPNERTGLQFLGAIIGDHVKTAISTRMMTGCIIGTGCMWAASAAAAGTIPPFLWCTDAGVKPFRHEKFIEVARAAMGRRKMTPGPAYLARLAALGG